MFKNRLKEIRKNNNLTQKEFGKKLNLSASTIAMYECGKREPDLYTISEISKIYNTSTDYILGLSNISNINSLIENDIIVEISKLPNDRLEVLKSYIEIIKKK